ncbi:MAG: hypothetical protein ACJ75Q_00200 [Gaiellaceae bacterium]
MRTGVVLVVLSLLAAAPAAGGTTDRYWSTAKLLRKLDGAKVLVSSRTVRIRSATTLCAGRGISIRRRGVRLWSRFLCTYTTFTKGGVDRDLDFRVRVRSATRVTIWDAHWIPTPRAGG